MGYLIFNTDREDEMSGLRHEMRRGMRGGYRYDGGSMMRSGSGSGYNDGYRMGYRHGWDDKEDEWEDEMEFRRRRDSRGRFM